MEKIFRGDRQFRNRLWAISTSVLVGAALMIGKFYGAWLTGSAAILSDALESIINVAASGFALYSIVLAAKHPDESHPYGHGKVEYFSAGFEGALIILAALAIFYTALPQIFHPAALRKLDKGVLIMLAISLVNLLLALGLVQVGRRTRSLALVADGEHLLTDVYTSAGVLLGLGLTQWSGWLWLDGMVACLVAVNILITGGKLMRESSAALMDASDPKLLEEISAILRTHRKSLWIDIHRLRARRAGNRVLLDFHLTLPRDLSLEAGHREVKDLEAIFNAHFAGQADVLVQLDPCLDPECPVCGYAPCAHRKAEARQQSLWYREVVTRGAGGEVAEREGETEKKDEKELVVGD